MSPTSRIADSARWTPGRRAPGQDDDRGPRNRHGRSRVPRGSCPSPRGPDPWKRRELHLIHIDNWFDHKWLGFSGKTLGALGIWKEGERLTVPAFTPNRVLSHQLLARTDADPGLHEESPPTELHLKVWSAVNLQRRVADIARRAALVWYSSNTRTNRRGAVMAYLPTDSNYDTWYVSLAANSTWAVEKTKQITRADFDALAASDPPRSHRL